MGKVVWAAPERNKGAILEVLERVLGPRGTLLEVASGTGQHIVHFAASLPHWDFVPSDVDAENRNSIEAFVAEAGLPNLRSPLALDVRGPDWGIGQVQAIFNANLVHITPWDCTEGLVRGAARHLDTGGLLIIYGPYRVGGAHTSPSNAEFDGEMRDRDPRFGVRDLEAVVALAEASGLKFSERVPMPANNQTLIFVREPVA
jgi:SAM-dependent methyltransferase